MPSWPPKHQALGRKPRELPTPPYTNGNAQGLDGQIGRTEAEATDSYQFVNTFYDANVDTIAPRSRNIAESDIDDQQIENSMNGFPAASQALIKGLTALGQVHPFIGVAVGAFVLVITLDLTRQDNDKKVLAVKLQMQDLMSALLELRHIRDSNERGPDGLTIASRLEGLMETIAKDVKACGSICDAYLKKSFLARTVKASKYETRLAESGMLFVEHRKTLEMALAIHTSLGVDSANQKLDGQHHRLQTIEAKLDMIFLFRKLDTPREKDVLKFIADHGGAKSCINNDELLEELVIKSGESLSRFSGRESGRRSNDLPDIKKKLVKELQEDIDEAFNRNLVLFERKLDVQSKQLADTVRQESDLIISTLMSGAHDRITDPDLQKIWKDMGWKGSVKARHFVLALHDYYTDRLNTDRPMSSTAMPSLPSPTETERTPMASPRKRQDDRWALAYINAAYVQPILEAVDDDGTGFVSVNEVNTFVAERPNNWTLPQWIAYWAVGWQASMSRYKDKIYEVVHTMFETLNYVLPSNRRAVDEYLYHSSFWRVELLLRSTRSVNPKVLSDADLSRYAENYAMGEEGRLDDNLQGVAYELDTPATVSLVTGVGRIERYVFPLIYLLLRRHLKVITLACKHVLDVEEFVSLNDSLVSVLLAIDHRVQNLEAIFKQTHLDVQGRLGNFAFGLFQLSFGDIKRVPVDNSFATWATTGGDSGNSVKSKHSLLSVKSLAANIPHDILKYGIRDGYSSPNHYEFEPERLLNVSNPIQGTWTGHCLRWDDGKPISYALRVSFRVPSISEPLKFVGKGEEYTGTFDCTGDVVTQDSALKFVFVITDDSDGLSRMCTGILDFRSDIITAHWSTGRRDDSGEDGFHRPFSLRRTPPALLRYRYTPDQFSEDPVRSRWSFACSASLHQAQQKLWSRAFFKARFVERKRFVELTTRSLIVHMGLTPQNPLSTAEKGELDYLRRELNPSEARFYQALAEFEIQKLPWHPAWGCDSCERRITNCRILCIQCISEDLSDNIDLCSACVDRAPIKRLFTHDVSHAVVKVEQTLHDYELARTVNAARVIFDRIKPLFRTIESNSLRPEENRNTALHNEASISDPSCTCCGKSVLPPCWVCVICSRDTFICPECDTKRRPSRSDGHTFAHALIRIRDSSIVGENATIEDKLLGLEQRLYGLEFKVAEGFASMESRVDERFSSLETKVERRMGLLQADVETRFGALDAVLRQIAAQTAALPAVYGHVVRDHARNGSIRAGLGRMLHTSEPIYQKVDDQQDLKYWMR